MNVLDTAATVSIPAGGRLEAIFARQHELMEKYLPIERANGMLETDSVPVNLQDRRGQARLKNFAWRTVEELTEATEALTLHPDDPTHFFEEEADALHFLVELLQLAGIGPEDILSTLEDRYGATTPEGTDVLQAIWDITPRVMAPRQLIPQTIHWASYRVVEDLGKAMNKLKLKPWKVSHVLTDVAEFHGHLVSAFESMVLLFKGVGLGPDEVTAMYFAKSEVNKFRQRSHY